MLVNVNCHIVDWWLFDDNFYTDKLHPYRQSSLNVR